MIPGAGGTNALQGIVRSITSPTSSRPTANSQAAEAARVRQLRRSRMAQQLQNNAVASGRGRLSQREIDTHLSEYGLD